MCNHTHSHAHTQSRTQRVGTFRTTQATHQLLRGRELSESGFHGAAANAVQLHIEERIYPAAGVHTLRGLQGIHKRTSEHGR